MHAFLLSTLLLLSLTGCDKLFQKPNVSVRRVDVTRVNFSELGANLVLAVDNPNVIGIDLARLGYQLTVDGHPFVQSGATPQALHVAAGGSSELTLPVSFKFVELAQALESLFTKQQLPFSIATQLGFGSPMGIVDVPLSYAGTFPVPQLPAVSAGGARVGAANIQGADLSTTINLTNRNGFALPIGALSVALGVNGVALANASTPPQELAANATVPLVLGAHLDYLKAGLGLVSAIQSRSATVNLHGSLDLLGYSLPIQLQTTLR